MHTTSITKLQLTTIEYCLQKLQLKTILLWWLCILWVKISSLTIVLLPKMIVVAVFLLSDMKQAISDLDLDDFLPFN